jgi:hypothetical protein
MSSVRVMIPTSLPIVDDAQLPADRCLHAGAEAARVADQGVVDEDLRHCGHLLSRQADIRR